VAARDGQEGVSPQGDGNFPNENSTFLLTDWPAHTLKEVLWRLGRIEERWKLPKPNQISALV
jgi:hypothetical protein